jgi:hypothetical protein
MGLLSFMRQTDRWTMICDTMATFLSRGLYSASLCRSILEITRADSVYTGSAD